jgi:hypothetical protein
MAPLWGYISIGMVDTALYRRKASIRVSLKKILKPSVMFLVRAGRPRPSRRLQPRNPLRNSLVAIKNFFENPLDNLLSIDYT